MNEPHLHSDEKSRQLTVSLLESPEPDSEKKSYTRIHRATARGWRFTMSSSSQLHMQQLGGLRRHMRGRTEKKQG
ncbi:hypothetical protein NDU88_000893 [Pleurodeles waltl]|uniref:Uncharacterized protein n=1 Tax=Pleurodeles waltl TaxID=8319 RepID=A0AAV7Q494_PLEWA|nr:hypothetical protein NDU88_000893 [Pleurodeles waltl]